MPIVLNFAADFSVFDTAEVVTYTRRNPDGTTSATYPGVNALREITSVAPAGVGGAGAQALATSSRWHFQSGSIPLPPRAFDVFTAADGTRWEVVDCGTPPLGVPYACNCKRIG